MLVPLVLRSIVLPYLRSTSATLATGSASTSSHAAAIAGTTTRALSTSTGRARAVEARLSQDEDDFRRIWQVADVRESRHRQQTMAAPLPPHTHGQAPLRREDSTLRRYGEERTLQQSSKRAEELEKPQDRSPKSRKPKAADAQSVTKAANPRRERQDLFDVVPGPPPFDLPPSVEKMLYAKLYRMTVFHILATPEYVANVDLVNYVVRRLKKNGAGKLARRLQKTLEMREFNDSHDPTRPTRLWSEPRTSKERRPATYWRPPPVTHDPSEYAGTPSERRTHFYNHRITTYLTKQHPAPYNSPVVRHMGPAPPAPRLSRVQDVLQYIDQLRKNNNFVPDRVTANIVMKAWMMSLSRRQDWLSLPLTERKRDLRDIFGLVAHSIEQGNQPALLTPPPGSDPRMPFDGEVDYTHHVRPFVKIMTKAMIRVGDHEARVAVEKWAEVMKARLAKEKTKAADAAKSKGENAAKSEAVEEEKKQ